MELIQSIYGSKVSIFGFDLNFVERDLVKKSQVLSKTLQEAVYFLSLFHNRLYI